LRSAGSEVGYGCLGGGCGWGFCGGDCVFIGWLRAVGGVGISEVFRAVAKSLAVNTRNSRS